MLEVVNLRECVVCACVCVCVSLASFTDSILELVPDVQKRSCFLIVLVEFLL